MAEPVDAPVSKTGGREAVRVRVPLSVPQLKRQAVVAELADAHGSGPCARKGVEVQVLSTAPTQIPEAATEMANGSRYSACMAIVAMRDPLTSIREAATP